jgi:hypothetical protein
MGTRSTIHFQENGETVCSIYQQYDGYPEGVGLELAEFLNSITIVNGIRPGQNDKIANRVGCLAAQFIAEQKNGPGAFYITDKDDRQEYNYFVNYITTGDFWMEYEDEPAIMCGDFAGNRQEFLEFCSN